jgi:hypothetical protein
MLVVAMDDTRVRKTGRKILTAFYQRDPLSPKFRFNLVWDCVSCIFRSWSPCTLRCRNTAPLPSRAVSGSPRPQKTRKKASPQQIEAYQQTVEHNLSPQCRLTARASPVGRRRRSPLTHDFGRR